MFERFLPVTATCTGRHYITHVGCRTDQHGYLFKGNIMQRVVMLAFSSSLSRERGRGGKGGGRGGRRTVTQRQHGRLKATEKHNLLVKQ